MPQDDREPPPRPRASVLTGLREGLHDGIELLRVRLELLGVEAQVHAQGLVTALACSVAAALLLSLGIGFLAVLLTVLLWDSHRLLALAVCTAVCLTLGAVLWWRAHRQWQASGRWLEATTTELARDARRLKP
jgi:uncharacterized membrane protein YqjE